MRRIYGEDLCRFNAGKLWLLCRKTRTWRFESSMQQCWTWSGFRIAIQSDSAIPIHFEKTSPDQIWISKQRWSLQSHVWSEVFFPDINRIGSNIWTDYRIRIGLDYTENISDWVRIAKISDPFNNCIKATIFLVFFFSTQSFWFAQAPENKRTETLERDPTSGDAAATDATEPAGELPDVLVSNHQPCIRRSKSSSYVRISFVPFY